MAESKRSGHAPIMAADETEQKKKDRMFLMIFFAGLVLVVVAMVLIAKFLSGS